MNQFIKVPLWRTDVSCTRNAMMGQFVGNELRQTIRVVVPGIHYLVKTPTKINKNINSMTANQLYYFAGNVTLIMSTSTSTIAITDSLSTSKYS